MSSPSEHETDFGINEAHFALAGGRNRMARSTSGHLRILDCAIVLELTDGVPRMTSGRQAWRDGHIPGSQYIDVLEELCDATQPIPMTTLPMVEFAEKMSDFGIGEGTKVVLYDRASTRGRLACGGCYGSQVSRTPRL